MHATLRSVPHSRPFSTPLLLLALALAPLLAVGLHAPPVAAAEVPEDPVDLEGLPAPGIYTFEIDGEDAAGPYRGTVRLIVADPATADPTVDAVRLVEREGDEVPERTVGSGVWLGGLLDIPLTASPLEPEASGDDLVVPLPKQEEGEEGNATRRLLGTVEATGGGRVAVRPVGGAAAETKLEEIAGQEHWYLADHEPGVETKVVEQTVSGWTRIDLELGEAVTAVRVRVPAGADARGVFTRGSASPALGSRTGVELAPTLSKETTPGRSTLGEPTLETPTLETPTPDGPEGDWLISAPEGAPNAWDPERGEATWVHRFAEGDPASTGPWSFWFHPGTDETVPGRFAIEPLILPWPEGLPLGLCDPRVSLDIFPRRVAPGEPITISVHARAFAGLDMLWWWGDGTGLPGFDKAHIAPGLGLVSRRAEWTVTIHQPGTYTFGANARDLLYPVAGEPHQASEGCGIDSETIEVDASLRKSYSVGFVLLTAPGTNVGDPAFQAKVSKIEAVQAELADQFDTSTQGDGGVDASYPLMILQPTDQPVGTDDRAGMYAFLRKALRQRLYSFRPDGFDFLAVYEDYDDVTIGSRHRTVRTFVTGLGTPLHDEAASWGTRGRLRGIGLITDVDDLPAAYDFLGSRMHLLLHETFGHQWGIYAPLLGDGHFHVGIQSPTFTVLYGRPWIQTGPGSFTTANQTDPGTGQVLVTFHPWIQYLAGLKTLAEVPASVLVVDPDTPPMNRYDLVTTTGTASTLTLQDVINQSGDRQDIVW